MGREGSVWGGQALWWVDRLSMGREVLLGGQALYGEGRLSRGRTGSPGEDRLSGGSQALRVEDRLSGGRGRHLEWSGTPGVMGCYVIFHQLTQVPTPRRAPPRTPPHSSAPLLALRVGGHHSPYRPGTVDQRGLWVRR